MDNEDRKIKIGQWNTNSYYQRKNEVEIMLNNLELSALIMNDTRCCSAMNIEISGYAVERSDHPDNTRRPGGSAIVIKNDLSYRRIASPVTESVCVEVDTVLGKIRIATSYPHPGDLLDEKLVTGLIKNSQSVTCFILAGDLNAHIGLEDHKDTDRAGLHLIDLMDKYNFHLLNNNDPTYSSYSCPAMSCLDLTYLKLNAKSNIQSTWQVLDPGSSDHFATLIELSDEGISLNRHRKNFIKITDWEVYKERFDNASVVANVVPESGEDIESLVTDIVEQIKTNLKVATQEVKIMRKNDMILSKESRKLIELRRNLLKLRRQKVTGNGELLRKILNKLSYDIKSSIKRDMDKYDNRRAMAILHENDPSKKWKLFKNFVNKGKTSNRIGDIIDLNGNRQSDDLSKSNAFAEKLSNFA